MSIELPMHLKQLEALPSALDVIRYLAKHPEGSAYPDEICEDLNISERRFNKAMRRLVTNSYMQMRSDSRYELGKKGLNAASELAEYDANAPTDRGVQPGKLSRDMVVACPRQLVAGKSADLLVGFEPFYGDGFNPPSDVIVRFEALYADLSSKDEMLKLDHNAHRQTLTLTPQKYDQVRFKVQVFQLSPDGEDLTDCGGMYIDVDVVEKGGVDALVAYSTNLLFTA